jgi:hypothetical protein
MKTLLLVGLAIVAIGCSSTPAGGGATPRPTATPAPWPEGWESSICYAIDQLGDAGGHFNSAIENGQAFDLDGAAEEAGKAAQDAKEAGEAVDAAGTWAPATTVTTRLRSAADNFRKASGLLKIGANGVDPATIEEANGYLELAAEDLKAANPGLTELKTKYGFGC